MKHVIFLSTYPNKKSAKKVANQLIKNRLAACVNLIQISSVYSWKGKLEDTLEYLVIIKTTTKNKTSLKKMIKSTHPYDVPEIAEIDVASINKPYLDWLIDSTS